MQGQLKLSTQARNLPQVIQGDRVVFNRCVGYCKPGEVYEIRSVQNSGESVDHNSVIHLAGAFGSTQINGYDLVYARIVELEGVN